MHKTRLTAVLVVSACYLSALVVFLVAYLKPDKVLRIGVNVYGEANLELAILLLTLPLCAPYLWAEIKYAMKP